MVRAIRRRCPVNPADDEHVSAVAGMETQEQTQSTRKRPGKAEREADSSKDKDAPVTPWKT
jgi:hypothetical protein